ncbi:type 4b pilus protein PilO2 [Salmonella enterica]|nr:type 4b pilus protein PilO2 [Salmonella enterica]
MFDKMLPKVLGNKNRASSNLLNENSIRILTINGNRFVVGLEWELIKAQRNIMKEVRSIGKARNLDVVAIREAEAIQAGFAPKTNHKLRGYYSLIVALASLMKQTCIVVVRLGCNEQGEEEFTLLGRTEKGTIHPDSDKICSQNEIVQAVVDLKQEIIGNRHDISIPVFGNIDAAWVTDELDLEGILAPENIKKDFRLKPLHWGMTKNQLISFTAVLLMSGVAALFSLKHYNEKEIRRISAAQAMLDQQEKINKEARYQAALDKLIHPWVTSSSIPVFLQGCEDGLKKFSLSIMGMTPGVLKCSQDGMSVVYNRPENSAVTVAEFVDAVRKMYGTSPDISITQTSMSAFFIKHSLQPNGDDPFQDMGQQLVKIISLFQSFNIPASLNEVSIKDVKKNEQGEDLPLQDWEEYTFDVQTAISPQLVFKNSEFIGMRINNIVYEIGQDQGSITYNITGSVYGKRILKP